eukprot:11406574-Heterocapsa_arctica.AAC.1
MKLPRGAELNPAIGPKEDRDSGSYAAGSLPSLTRFPSYKEPYPCVLISLNNSSSPSATTLEIQGSIEYDPKKVFDPHHCPKLLGNRKGAFLTAHAYGSAKKTARSSLQLCTKV